MWFCLITALREERPSLWFLSISMADFKLQTRGPSIGERGRALVLAAGYSWGTCPQPPRERQLPHSEPVSWPPWVLRGVAYVLFHLSRTWLLPVLLPPLQPPLSLSCSQPFHVSWILFMSPKTALTVPYLEEPTLLFPGPSSFSFPSPHKLNL